VKRIRKIKEREDQPFSVIAPGEEWIKENCIIDEQDLGWLDKLPGQYTFVLRLNKSTAISKEVNPGLNTVGVRIPDNWFSGIVSEMGFPVVTTSVNKHGEEFMTSMENLDPDIKASVDYIFYEGIKKSRPSTLVVLTENKEIKER
ncbi:Sua5/YciO/YrdC/YwlC family protein, partial [Candidatus Woesearchaeota archaeon]|nr:Sua5/YciO/YrdC/YwlC family protein [Candidatus Woesearchaeota archaeon]